MDTIAAPITPLMESSVILIRVSGSLSLNVLDLINIKNKTSLEPKRVYYGVFESMDKKIKDDCLFYFFKAPNSYTGEDVVEISFHGNPLIIDVVLRDIYNLGIRQATGGEFTRRAFLNGKIDLTQAEAVFDMIASKSTFAINSSYKRLKGVVKNKIDEVKDCLVDAMSVVNAFIDFSEDDIDESAFEITFEQMKNSCNIIKVLLENYRNYYLYEKSGLKVVVAGKPNVGKSSLFNCLINCDRSIVSDLPGTTRDYIDSQLYLNDYKINIIDTAGIRNLCSGIEKAGANLSEKLIEESDLVIVLFDISTVFDNEDEYILSITKDKSRIIVANKCDLSSKFLHPCDIAISVKENINIDKLKEAISERLKTYDSDDTNDLIIVAERHAHMLAKILNVLEDILKFNSIDKLDIISIELQRAMRYLSEITGEIYTEDILDNIFKKFCIGK